MTPDELAEQICSAITVHGFENDADAERCVFSQKASIAGLLRKKLLSLKPSGPPLPSVEAVGFVSQVQLENLRLKIGSAVVWPRTARPDDVALYVHPAPDATARAVEASDWKPIDTLPLLVTMNMTIEVCHVDFGAQAIVKYRGGKRDYDTMTMAWTHWRRATPMPEKTS